MKEWINELRCKLWGHKYRKYSPPVEQNYLMYALIGAPYRKCSRCGDLKYRKRKMTGKTVKWVRYGELSLNQNKGRVKSTTPKKGRL